MVIQRLPPGSHSGLEPPSSFLALLPLSKRTRHIPFPFFLCSLSASALAVAASPFCSCFAAVPSSQPALLQLQPPLSFLAVSSLLPLSKCFACAAEAAEYPARRLAAGATFRTQPTPADMHRGRANNPGSNSSSMPAVERSGDSPRDVHRRSLQARGIMPRSRSRDSNGSSTTAEDQAVGVSRSILFAAMMCILFSTCCWQGDVWPCLDR